ncbi:hypothetical protein J4732_11520 [Serratia marcescens]|uniref:Uncharacterized protein n=1 Tax=Serratia marcescens TaxID=615 RepID=A0A939NM23_SERMA|nr:hypothetical protein [Serratia marcescens]
MKPPLASYLTMTAAHVNNVFLSLRRIGGERSRRTFRVFADVGTNGWPIGAIASVEDETILYADR